MEYYRAKKSITLNSYFIANGELLTKNEVIRNFRTFRNIKMSDFFDLVNINKNNTAFVFGVRKEFI